MTTDRAKEVVNDAFGSWYSEYAGSKHYNEIEAKEARDTAIKALDEVERYKQAIEDIKAEINTPNRNTCDYFIVDQIEKIVKEVSK